MVILHGDMTHGAEFCLPPRRLAIETALRIGRARRRLVRAFLAAQIRAVSFIVVHCRRRPWPESSSATPTPRSKSHPPKNARPTRAASPAGDQKLRHELLKHLAVLQSIPVLGAGSW